MNTSKLPAIFREKTRISDEDYALLIELRRRYPYFQAAHILVAKAARDRGELDAPGFLRSASLHAGDRKALYDYLISPAIRKHISDFEKELSVAEISVEPVADTMSGFTREEKTKDLSPENAVTGQAEAVKAEPEKEVLSESGPTITPEENSVQFTPPNKEVVTENQEEDQGSTDTQAEEFTVRDKSLEEIEKEILYEAIYSSIEKEVQEDMASSTKQYPEEKTGGEEAASEVVLKAHSPFTAWLLKRAAETRFMPAAESTEGTTGETAGAKEKAKRLIDDFIQKDPRITPAKADVYSSENLGRMSLAENEEFVTETLAKIYVRQGKADKAIKAYKLLMLKFPEKSIYFANQLKKLEENRK